MHSSTFISAIPAIVAFLAIANAAPYAPGPSCPEGQDLITDGTCTSGFIGCVSSWHRDAVCNGPRRFWNDCSSASWTGNFYNCANGFKGCTTKTTICDTPKVFRRMPSVTPKSHPLCPPSTPLYYAEGQCPSNFIGCVDSARANEVCLGEKRFYNDCHNAQGLGFWQNCQWNNNFKGCINDFDVCARKASGYTPSVNYPNPPVTSPVYPPTVPSPPVTPPVYPPTVANPPVAPPVSPPTKPVKPVTPDTPSKVCKADEVYHAPSVCQSGFAGCAKASNSVAICQDPVKLAPNSCPAGYSFFSCGNGFKGCVVNDGRDVCGFKRV